MKQINNRLLLGCFALISAISFSCEDPGNIFEEAEEARRNQYLFELDAIDTFLEEQNLDAEIDTTYGIRYIIHEPGNDTVPFLQDSLLVNYSGRLLGSSENFDQGDSTKFLLNGLIDGWRLSLFRIGEGGDITLYIPSAYGYGPSGIGNIPGNATLVFDIELIDVIRNNP